MRRVKFLSGIAPHECRYLLMPEQDRCLMVKIECKILQKELKVNKLASLNTWEYGWWFMVATVVLHRQLKMEKSNIDKCKQFIFNQLLLVFVGKSCLLICVWHACHNYWCAIDGSAFPFFALSFVNRYLNEVQKTAIFKLICVKYQPKICLGTHVRLVF